MMVGQVENDVKATSNKIEKILAEANLEGGLLAKGVMETALRNRDKLSSLKTHLASQQQEVRSLAKDELSTTEDLMSAHNRKIEVLQKKMDGTRQQIEDVLGLQRYQSGDAFKKVFYLLDEAIKLDKDVKTKTQDVIAPAAAQWRSQIERVFEAANSAMDLERVERMAAASAQAEDAEGEGMLSAKEKMDKEIQMTQKRMQNEIDWVREKAAKMIAEIQASEHLSKQEKEARITAITKKADREIYALVVKTKKLISDQYMSQHKLDEEINELNALMERAKVIAGAGNAESREWKDAMLAELKERLDSLRQRYIETSLAEVSAKVSEAASEKVRRVALAAGVDTTQAAGANQTLAEVRKAESESEASGESLVEAAAKATIDLAAVEQTQQESDKRIDEQLKAIDALEAKLPPPNATKAI